MAWAGLEAGLISEGPGLCSAGSAYVGDTSGTPTEVKNRIKNIMELLAPLTMSELRPRKLHPRRCSLILGTLDGRCAKQWSRRALH